MPISPTGLKCQPGESGHQIELGRPGVAVHDWEHSHLARLGEHDLGGGQGLGHRVMFLDDQPGQTLGQSTTADALMSGLGRVGHPSFDHEPSPQPEVARRVGEASDLGILIRHGVDRVDE